MNSPSTSSSSMCPRERVSFNQDWVFTQGDPADASGLDYEQIKPWVLPSGNPFRASKSDHASLPDGHEPASPYAEIDYDHSGWRPLSLPHDWGIEGPFRQEYPGETGKLPWWGVGWYRKSFELPKTKSDSRFYLDFDGAMSYALVWINGRFAGGWPYGYASFRIDLTPFLKSGQPNTIAVRLDNPPESSRWYPGGGIYRNVWLVKTAPVHVDQWGTSVTTPAVSTEAATVNIKVDLTNHSPEDRTVTIRTTIFPIDTNNEPASQPVVELAPQELTIAPGSSITCKGNAQLKKPALWSTAQPNRYLARTTIEENGQRLDSYDTTFGIRTTEFNPRGFFLNGEQFRLNGVCQHHDLGALGAALYPRALERQVEILREMGVNAIRTSHNPPAPELLDLCDKWGLLVIDEAFDTWAHAKKPNDYHRLFPDWHEADLRAMIRRDRNHPSVVLWSTGNEIAEQHAEGGKETSRRLAAIARSEDPTRPTTVGCNVPEAADNGFQQTMDVFGFNYKPHKYGPFRKENPTIPCYGSETASTISSRGEYVFPVSDDRNEGRENFHMSSYDLYTPPWATTPDTEFTGQDECPFSAGEFVWTGFDYLGEPTPYNADSTNLLNFSNTEERERMAEELAQLGRIAVPSRSSYFGIIDLAGFKKDRFYIYQARWRPDLPMAHILPHWNWPERVGKVTPVHVYTSGDEAELFLNGRSLGRRQKGEFQYRLRWDDVVYEPGELKVLAFKNGQPWAEAIQRTTGPAVALSLSPDRSAISSDGADLSFVTLAIVDENGLTVPRSGPEVTFSISGPGEIIATDNGDPTDHQEFPSLQRHAFNGLALAIVKRQAGQSAPIMLRAEADGLAGADVVIDVIS